MFFCYVLPLDMIDHKCFVIGRLHIWMTMYFILFLSYVLVFCICKLRIIHAVLYRTWKLIWLLLFTYHVIQFFFRNFSYFFTIEMNKWPWTFFAKVIVDVIFVSKSKQFLSMCVSYYIWIAFLFEFLIPSVIIHCSEQVWVIFWTWSKHLNWILVENLRLLHVFVWSFQIECTEEQE